jgi:hypothetical protein
MVHCTVYVHDEISPCNDANVLLGIEDSCAAYELVQHKRQRHAPLRHYLFI